VINGTGGERTNTPENAGRRRIRHSLDPSLCWESDTVHSKEGALRIRRLKSAHPRSESGEPVARNVTVTTTTTTKFNPNFERSSFLDTRRHSSYEKETTAVSKRERGDCRKLRVSSESYISVEKIAFGRRTLSARSNPRSCCDIVVPTTNRPRSSLTSRFE